MKISLSTSFAFTLTALAAWPASIQAQQGCRIVKRAGGPSATPAMAALAAVNFGMEGRVRAVLVDTAVRESHRLGPESPERIPIVGGVPKAAVAALSTDSLPFGFAAYNPDWEESDTARVALILLTPSATATARATDFIPHGPDRAAVIVYVYGRPFPANFFDHVMLRKSGPGWVAERMSCFEE